MYPIPAEFKIEKLIGKNIQQICYSLNTITICFDDFDDITIEDAFTLSCNGKTRTVEELYPIENDFGLLCLLEKKITGVGLSEDRMELIIKIEDDITLVLLSTPYYESFSISIDKQRIIM